MTLQRKAVELPFPVMMLTKLQKAALTFESVHEIPKSGHSNEKAVKQHFPVAMSAVLYKVCFSRKPQTRFGPERHF